MVLPVPPATAGDDPVESFIARWDGRPGGAERANYAMFLAELTAVIGAPPPDPAAVRGENDYCFERPVTERLRDGSSSTRRIDLYRRDCFVLEAKQSRMDGDKRTVDPAARSAHVPAERGRRGASRAWDVLMMNARAQAEDYVRLLPDGHRPPPFVVVCDVGHCIELYANFRRDGKAYDQFPDRQGFRVYLDDLRDPAVRARLRAVWCDPESLDPARRAAAVTRLVAERLAAVSKVLERSDHPAEEVAGFLTRCIFTMFAEDAGLLPHRSFRDLLQRCERNPADFVPFVGQLWEAMDTGQFAFAIGRRVPHFNGRFFKRRAVLPLAREEIGALRVAAEQDWRSVEPAIFGTLLEQALDPGERRRLGAHYTPRPYVERLVAATVVEPLREDWSAVLATAQRQREEGRAGEASATVRAFHDRLCAVRVLDPACGTGNFLYVALELVKRLEGEVLEALADLGGQEALTGLAGHTVDPHQFLGIEVNPRAAAIAELVLWIGHLQWHLRTRGGAPSEPILRAFGNIETRDAVLAWDGYPHPVLQRDAAGRPATRLVDGASEEIHAFPNPRLPPWPAAEFIVGNPPFIGGKDVRARLGDAYAQALWDAHPDMNDSADFVMYWWDRAADLITRKGSVLRRFGFVTTNSISQVFQRRTLERYMAGKTPVSLVMAIPDHPWTKATPDAAAARIAMTVAEAGSRDGVLREVTSEAGLETDQPAIFFEERTGRIHADLTVGVDITKASELLGNSGVCHDGVKLHGTGFRLHPREAEWLGLGSKPGLDRYIRPYRNGRDLAKKSRDLMVIDLYGLAASDVRAAFPEIYQFLLERVKPVRDAEARRSGKKDAQTYAEYWWLFGKPRPDLRSACSALSRCIVTVDTARHRVFQFTNTNVVYDDKCVLICHDDALILGILSSRIHVDWANRAGGRLGVGNDPVYVKTRTFDPFPFPDASPAQAEAIRRLAEELDAHRKARLAAHPHLTLTGLYNVLEELRAGTAPDALSAKSRRIYEDGLVLILKELHDTLDAAVAAAYGWSADLPDEEVLARLVALNRRRSAEEAAGQVRWLRPDYQVPRFGTPAQKAEFDLGGTAPGQPGDAAGRPAFPRGYLEQTAAVMAMLAAAPGPVDPGSLAAAFRQGRRTTPTIAAILGAASRTGRLATTPDGRFTLRRAG